MEHHLDKCTEKTRTAQPHMLHTCIYVEEHDSNPLTQASGKQNFNLNYASFQLPYSS
uniref:Uncharacterized protein n=1 Tax=Rhizophora mucronata TaxID=61149 RepID=A0A2P2P1M4_RHIMU